MGGAGDTALGYEVQCQDGDNSVPYTRRTSPWHLMYCPYLGGSGWPAYPSCFHDTEGIDETQARPSHGISHHTVWPKEVVILPAHSDESWSELETSPRAEPVVLRHSALPISKVIQPDSLEVDPSLLRVRGLSIAVLSTLSQSRSVSMKKAYTGSGRSAWPVCLDREMMEAILHSGQMLEFLWNGLDRRLSTSTLKVQVAAMSIFQGRPLFQEPLVMRLIKGSIRVSSSVLKPISLRGLCASPFRPLSPS